MKFMIRASACNTFFELNTGELKRHHQPNNVNKHEDQSSSGMHAKWTKRLHHVFKSLQHRVSHGGNMRIVLAVEFCFDARTEQRIKLHARLTKKSEQQFFSVKTKFFSVKINMQCWFLSDVAHDCFIHSLWACTCAQHAGQAWSTQHLPISLENRHQQRRWKTTNFFTTLLHSLLAKHL